MLSPTYLRSGRGGDLQMLDDKFLTPGQGRPQGGGGGQLGHFAPGPSRLHEGPLEYLFKRLIYSNRAV